jgi:hypothetical protein
MLETSTLQKTIYLYWSHYREFSDIKEAVKFSQKIYMAEHRHIFELLNKYLSLDHLSAISQINCVDSTKKEKTT